METRNGSRPPLAPHDEQDAEKALEQPGRVVRQENREEGAVVDLKHHRSSERAGDCDYLYSSKVMSRGNPKTLLVLLLLLLLLSLRLLRLLFRRPFLVLLLKLSSKAANGDVLSQVWYRKESRREGDGKAQKN
eukprot:765600-Hanusia_phi.AAC.2